MSEHNMHTNKTISTHNPKKQIADARVGIIDTETGEVLDEGSLIYVPKKLRIKGFFMAMQEGLERVAKSSLKVESFRVLMLLMSRMDYENKIHISQKEICEILSMKKQNVSRAMKSLRENGVIDPAEYCTCSLNPDIGWKGKVQNMHKRQSVLQKQAIAELSKSNEEKQNAQMEAMSDDRTKPLHHAPENQTA